MKFKQNDWLNSIKINFIEAAGETFMKCHLESVMSDGAIHYNFCVCQRNCLNYVEDVNAFKTGILLRWTDRL